MHSIQESRLSKRTGSALAREVCLSLRNFKSTISPCSMRRNSFQKRSRTLLLVGQMTLEARRHGAGLHHTVATTLSVSTTNTSCGKPTGTTDPEITVESRSSARNASMNGTRVYMCQCVSQIMFIVIQGPKRRPKFKNKVGPICSC